MKFENSIKRNVKRIRDLLRKNNSKTNNERCFIPNNSHTSYKLTHVLIMIYGTINNGNGQKEKSIVYVVWQIQCTVLIEPCNGF